jgi:hypothetical protein
MPGFKAGHDGVRYGALFHWLLLESDSQDQVRGKFKPIGFSSRSGSTLGASPRGPVGSCDATAACPIRKLTSSDPDLDAFSSNYRPWLLAMFSRVRTAGGELPMMGRLRSTMQMLGPGAALICALCLAGPSASHAAASNPPGTDDVGPQPCNDACKAYMAWSDRVAARLRPSSPVAQTAVHDGKAAGAMAHRRASQMGRPGVNAFAQFPVQRAATAQSAETAQAVVAPSRAVDGIAERFPTTAGFVTALLASPPGATDDAPESPVVSVPDAIPAMRAAGPIDDPTGRDMRLAASLFLALTLSALVVRGWSRRRTRIAMR